MTKKRDRGPRGTGPNDQFRKLGDVQQEYEQNKDLFEHSYVTPKPRHEPEVMRARAKGQTATAYTSTPTTTTRWWKFCYGAAATFATLRFMFMIATCIQLVSLGFAFINVSKAPADVIDSLPVLSYQIGSVSFLAALTTLCTVMAEFFSGLGVNHLRKRNDT